MAAEQTDEDNKSAAKLAPSWWTPLNAVTYASLCVGAKGASQAIWQLLVGGMIDAIATSSSFTPKDGAPRTSNEPRLIPNDRWKSFTDVGSDFWVGGYARFWLISRHGSTGDYRAFGIKLNPDDLKANLPAPNPALHSPKPKPAPSTPVATDATSKVAQKNGGRPRASFWDDLLIEMSRRIFDNELKPERPADIEKAMLEWATNHSHDLSEASARSRAKKLFKALISKG